MERLGRETVYLRIFTLLLKHAHVILNLNHMNKKYKHRNIYQTAGVSFRSAGLIFAKWRFMPSKNNTRQAWYIVMPPPPSSSCRHAMLSNRFRLSLENETVHVMIMPISHKVWLAMPATQDDIGLSAAFAKMIASLTWMRCLLSMTIDVSIFSIVGEYRLVDSGLNSR